MGTADGRDDVTSGAGEEWASFVSALPNEAGQLTPQAPELRRILAVAERQRPELSVARTPFAEFVARQSLDPSDPLGDLSKRHVADLLLVFAFETQVAGADRAVDEMIRSVASRVATAVRTGMSTDAPPRDPWRVRGGET